MRQDNLADPDYFNFISFAQYAAMLWEMADLPSAFKEHQPVETEEGQPQEFDAAFIRRNPSRRVLV